MSCIYFLLCQARTARGWRQSRGQLGISSTIPHAMGSAVGAGKAVNVERTRLQATPPSNPAGDKYPTHKLGFVGSKEGMLGAAENRCRCRREVGAGDAEMQVTARSRCSQACSRYAI